MPANTTRPAVSMWVIGDAAGARRLLYRMCRMCRGESSCGALAAFGCFPLAIFGWGIGSEVGQEPFGGSGDRPDGLLEGSLVRQRRLAVAGYLADELQRGVAYLVAGGRRVEVEERLDVAAHGLPCLRSPAPAHSCRVPPSPLMQHDAVVNGRHMLEVDDERMREVLAGVVEVVLEAFLLRALQKGVVVP